MYYYKQTPKYMSEFAAKKMICEIGKRMYDRNFVASNDGNISVRVGKNAFICTPTGVSKGFMTPDMLVKVNLKGDRIAGRLKPSSEMKMHLRVYEENEEVMAVTHAHPPVATSFSIAGIELNRPLLSEAVVLLGRVPIAPYATPGTQEVPDSIAPFCKDHNAVLLANHGALTWGKSLEEAYHRLETLEHYATILMYTSRVIGETNELNCDQVGTLINLREKMGIKTGGVPTCSPKELDKGFNEENTKIETTKSINKDEIIEAIVAKVTQKILLKLDEGR
jgi:L-fuculose-phosphate aldolase